MGKGTRQEMKEEDVDPASERVPICFTTLMKQPDVDLGTADKPGDMKNRGAGTGQKKVKLDIILEEQPDPMVLTFQGKDIQRLFQGASLTVNPQEVVIMVDDKNNYIHEVIQLPERIVPQFSAGYFEGNVLNLFLKKHGDAADAGADQPEPMVWCSENVFAELEQVKARAEENLERFHAVQLDLQNLIVKSKREKKEYEDRFASGLLLSILEVQDNFDRALEAEKKTRGKRSLMEGVNMIRKQLDGVLSCNGVSEMDALGKPFDPMKHEALIAEENPDVEENTILEVIQKGYMYNDKVLRLAKVKVSK